MRAPLSIQSSQTKHPYHVTVVVLLVLLLSAGLWAQTGTSNIRGTVTDAQGRVVSGATVTITNQATSATRTLKTSETGGYSFDLITPGEYKVEVGSPGFRKQQVTKVHALVGKPTELNIKLEVGAASEVVEVQASSEGFLANTQDASLGNNIVTQQITDLPLEGRSFSDLLSLQPGATQQGYVTGARADQGNFTLDGVDINNAQSANAVLPSDTNTLVIGSLGSDRTDITQGAVLRLNTEAIEEFRVTTANGNANQGRSSGAQVNLVTKSGSNTIHGSAFEFYRTKGFTANDWFNNHAGVGREDLIRHTFGGTVGGPIIKDKLFFFYSFEGRHESRSLGVTRVMPLASMGTGALNYTYDDGEGNVLNAALTPDQVQEVYSEAGINPLAVQIFADASAKFAPNDTSQGDQLNTGGYRFNANTPTRLNSHVAKFDYNLNSHQTVFARVNVIYDHQTLASWLPDTKSPEIWNHPWGVAAGHTWLLGNWVNNFRYGLTRQAFTDGGDSDGNDIGFRFVYFPNDETHSVSRITPVHNFTDDVSLTKGKHTLQFGVNIRKISNQRISFANAFDNAITNPSWYSGGGESVSDTFQQYLDDNGLPGDENAGQDLASASQIQNAATALIGRLSQYSAVFSFDHAGTPSSLGQPTARNFATQAYDSYVQDAWKVRPNLTLTLGLRYSLERPVYETTGFEVQPEMPLGTFFANRLAAAAQGQNYQAPIVINLSGPANHGKPMYNWDKNNFQPRIAVAWSPGGANGKSVLRGGFAITNDYYGQALAVDFDLNNTLGFTSSANINANTYDIFDGTLAPEFTAFNQDIRHLPGIEIPGQLTFPLSQPSDFGERIETSIDSNLHAPKQYVWNFTFERQMPKGLLLSASYIGRQARGLLARRDVAAFNDIRDPQSGMDWYTAGTMLEKQRQQGVDTNQVATIPFFENLMPAGMATIMNDVFGLDPACDANVDFPGFDPAWSNTQVFYAMQSRSLPSNPCAFFAGNDWTDTEALIDQVLDIEGAPTLFMHPQYGALSAWSTIGNSNYHAFTFSARERLSSLTLDFNYTFSHSLDDSSGLQTAGGFGSAFITNPIRQHDSYANSDFDVRQTINANAIWQLPFGKGKSFLGGASRGLDAVIGGWQLSSIFRWNTGLPQTAPFDDARWATNWNVQANVTPTSPVHTCPTRNVDSPKLFGSCDTTKVYQSFRNAYPGETGPRNIYRLPGYIGIDFGLSKSWTMPWREDQKLTFRWEVFNATNTQHFGAIDVSRTGFGVGRDPARRGLDAPDNWSNFTQIQGSPRSMQVGLRYAF